MKRSLFELKDSWIWFAIVVVSTLLVWRAFSYAATTHNQLSDVATIVLLCTLSTVYAIVCIRYYARWNFIKSIVGYTTQGTTITITDAKMRNKLTEDDKLKLVNRVSVYLNAVARFWNSNFYVLSTKVNTSIKYYSVESLEHQAFYGVILSVVPEPFYSKRWYDYKLSGVSYADRLVVVWDGVEETIPVFNSLVKHEAGHTCLRVLGIESEVSDNELHHKLFTEMNYGA